VVQVQAFEKDFDDTIKSFTNMHIDIEEVISILRVCCGILFMGNVRFNGRDESEVEGGSDRWIKKFIKVLEIKGIDEKNFKKVITS